MENNTSSLILKKSPRLKDFQQYVDLMVKERGFDKESIEEIFMLFTEECGEVAKAIRKRRNIHSDEASKHHKLEEEVADVFIYLLDICNYFDIDLEKAFREKEDINKRRTWKQG